MNGTNQRMKRWICVLLSAVLPLLAGPAWADWNRTQTISLTKGWNAVFFEVAPSPDDPEALFAGTAVGQALTFYPKSSSVQFIQDPEEADFKKQGWHRWVPAEHPESVLNDLFALQANQAYLLFASEDYDLTVAGEPDFRPRQWRPDAFNFTGFHVDPQAPPTFFQFFEGSKAHKDMNIFALKDNHWAKIEEPAAENIVSGRAYWVYCKGGSDFQGPMEIALPAPGDGLRFQAAISEFEIEITNRSPNPLSFFIEQVPAASPDDAIPPLSQVSYSDALEKSFAPFAGYAPDAPLESGESVAVRLAIRRKEIQQNEVSGLLKISDDVGNAAFIKVWAEKLEE